MTDSAPDDAASTRRDVDRVMAFSDGVFAIAITLLVLSTSVPTVPNQDLGKALRGLLPDLAIWWYLNDAHLIPTISREHVRVGLLRAGLAPAVFALSIPVAVVTPDWSKLVRVLIVPGNIILGRRYQEVSSGP